MESWKVGRPMQLLTRILFVTVQLVTLKLRKTEKDDKLTVYIHILLFQNFN